jgi:heme-binding NEAT domain protein
MISNMKNQIEALLIERAGYEMRGLKDRVKAVDAVLRELGFEHKYLSEPKIETASIEPVAERATRKAAPKRKA